MSLTSETVMPVVPAGMTGYNGGSSNGGGMWGNDGAWIIILFFIFALCGGWGNGWNNGNNGGGSVPAQGYDTRADVQRSFDTQGITSKLDVLSNGMCQQGYQNQQGFHDVDNAVCQLGYQVQQGFHGVDNALCQQGYQNQQGFNALNTTLLQGFNSSNVALMQGQNALASQLATCCCDTQRGLDGINYNMATQACAMQNTIQNSTRDILESQNNSTRQILDYLCNDKISTLQSENQALRLAASQTAQNATLMSAMTANTNEILNRAAPTPVPSYSVPAPYPYSPCCNPCGCAA